MPALNKAWLCRAALHHLLELPGHAAAAHTEALVHSRGACDTTMGEGGPGRGTGTVQRGVTFELCLKSQVTHICLPGRKVRLFQAEGQPATEVV